MMTAYVVAAWTGLAFLIGVAFGRGIKLAEEQRGSTTADRELDKIWPHETELDCELPPAPPKPLSLCPDYALPTADGRLIEVWM